MTDAWQPAVLFLVVGVALVASARASRRTGVAETEEGDVLRRRDHPLRFRGFVAAQYAFGVLSILVAAALLAASWVVGPPGR